MKTGNLLANPHACAALENGSQPLIAECETRTVAAPYPAALSEAFLKKYEWDITRDGEYSAMFALKPRKWLSWNAA